MEAVYSWFLPTLCAWGRSPCGGFDSSRYLDSEEHGLLILGKRVLTEWVDVFALTTRLRVGMRSLVSYPKQCPGGGSSGGSAGASDLGLAWATLGTELLYDGLRILCFAYSFCI